MLSLKVVVVGDASGRGKIESKRMFLHHYINGVDSLEYYPTVIDNMSLNVMVDDRPISLGLWDTSGQEDYDRLRPLSYPQTDVFILLFSIDSPVSFENIQSRWFPEVSHHCPDTLKFIVGFGTECRTDQAKLEELQIAGIQPITKRQGELMARETGCIYLECTVHASSIESEVIFPAIRHFLKPPESLTAKKSKKLELETRYRIKLLVLGHGGSGKTSLLNAMGERKKVKQLSITQSTIGFDVFHMPISKIVDFSIYDFAGQLEYLTSHKYFLSTKSALYMIIVDVSQSIQSQKDQLQHWLQLLQTELPLGQNTKYALILVGTKIDKINDFPAQRATIEKKLLEEISTWNLNTPHLWKLEIPTIWFISSFDGNGIKKLRSGLTSIGQKLAMEGTPHVPKLFRIVEEILRIESETFSLSLFMNMDKLFQIVKERLVTNQPEQQQYFDNLMWADFIDYQHDIGTMMVLPSANMVCLNPNILSKMMSLFIAPEEHILRLHGAAEESSRSAIVSHVVAMKRLRGMPELAEFKEDDLDQILGFLEILGICYKLKEREEESYGQGGYMFLSLRPSADVLMIPSAEGDHSEKLLMRTCTPYAACRCGYKQSSPHNLPSHAAPKCPRCLTSNLLDVHRHNGEQVCKVLYQDPYTLAIAAVDINGVRIEWPKENFRCFEEICGIKYLGAQISSKLHAGITKDNFTRFQTKLRNMHDMRYKVYTNGILLKDFFGNQLLCQHSGREINVAIRGYVPKYWILSLEKVIEFIKGQVVPYCPACVQMANGISKVTSFGQN